MSDDTGPSLYERLGGRDALVRIVDRFYDGVATDPVLRPLYPDDLGPPRERLALFLVQWTGGPDDYQRSRGHPKLRLRHFEFPIGPVERDAWVALMTLAVDGEGLAPELHAELLDALRKTAGFLVNRGGLSLGRGDLG